MSRLENLMEMTKLNELISKKEKKNTLWAILAVVGVIAAIAGVCYAIYRRRNAEYLAEFDDEFFDECEEAEDELFVDEGEN